MPDQSRHGPPLTKSFFCVTTGYMTPREFRHIREFQLGLSQAQLAVRLGLARISVLRYENGQRRIPDALALALQHLAASPPRLPLVGLVAAGAPIEPIPQYEEID